MWDGIEETDKPSMLTMPFYLCQKKKNCEGVCLDVLAGLQYAVCKLFENTGIGKAVQMAHFLTICLPKSKYKAEGEVGEARHRQKTNIDLPPREVGAGGVRAGSHEQQGCSFFIGNIFLIISLRLKFLSF